IEPVAECPLPLVSIAGSMTTMAWVPYITRPWPMPGVEDVPDAAIRTAADNNHVLAVVSNRRDTLDAWSRRLDRMGLGHLEIAHHRVPLLASAFTIHAWKIPVTEHLDGVVFGPPVLSISAETPPEVNVYGTPKGQLSVEGSTATFRPTDPGDHVAYPFAK